MPLEKLKAVVIAEGEEQQRQDELQQVLDRQAEDSRDRYFEDMSKEQIEQELVRRTEQAKVEATPEYKAEKSVRNLEQETRDLQYVHDSLQKTTNEQLENAILRKTAELQDAQNRSLAIQQEWCNSHPEYVRSPENGEAMRNFVRDEGKYSAFTTSNLELAFSVLKARHALTLLNPDQIEARKQLQETGQTGETSRPRRASSSVSTRDSIRSSGGFYNRPVKQEYTEEDLYSLPMDRLAQLAFPDGSDAELAEQNRGIVRTTRPQILSQF